MTPNGQAREHIDFIVANLVERRRMSGSVPSELVASAARSAGVSARTMWRWIERNGRLGSREPARWIPSKEDKLLYVECRGNIAEVHRRRRAAGLTSPTVRQLQRAFKVALTPAERAYARDGEQGYRRYSVYLRVEQEHRNELWQMDHVELPVYVTVPRRTGWFKPWMTAPIDGCTRAVPGYAVSLQPTAAEVLAGLRKAITVDPMSPFGGVPDLILWDNGAEFLSDVVTDRMADLGCVCAPTQAYAPHQKGKIERFFRTLEDEFLRSLPYYAHGPKAANGKLYGPSNGPLGLDELVARLDEYLRHYNCDRTHSAIGMTPLARWERDSAPIRHIDESQLRWMLLGSKMRRVRWEGTLFFATELQGLVGEEIEVRYTPHDLRRIWLFRDGEFLCEAVPHIDVPEDVRRAHLGNRTAQKRDVQHLRRETSRKERSARYRKGKIEPMTGPGDVVDTVAPTPTAPRRKERRTSAATLELLGITGLNAPVDDEVHN